MRKLLSKPVFKSWREAVGRDEAARIFAERVSAIEGSLDDGAGAARRPRRRDPQRVDRVVRPADRRGVRDERRRRVAASTAALRASGADPHVVHVSTCYVGGVRKGVLPEASLDHDADWRVESEAAAAARQRVELRSRESAVLRGLMRRARAEHGKEGPRAVAQATEAARIDWVKDRLVIAGRSRAQSLGWTDVYTLTKALAERAAEELWGAEHRLSVVRPSVIESALQHPFPGWIDGFKVADPLIIAFGRGQLPDFPGVPDSVLDIIPVDFVVNAILAAAATPPPAAEPRYLHIASGASNPLPFHGMYRQVHEYFTANPIPDTPGAERVPTWQFPGDRRVERAIRRAEVVVGAANTALDRLPSTPRTREWQRTMGRRERDVANLRQLSDLYRAYVGTELIFDDRNARALQRAHPRRPADRGLRRHADRLERLHAAGARARDHAADAGLLPRPRSSAAGVDGAEGAPAAHRRARRVRPRGHRRRVEHRAAAAVGAPRAGRRGRGGRRDRLDPHPAAGLPRGRAPRPGRVPPDLPAPLRRDAGRTARGGRARRLHRCAGGPRERRRARPRAGAPRRRAPDGARHRIDRRAGRAARRALRRGRRRHHARGGRRPDRLPRRSPARRRGPRRLAGPVRGARRLRPRRVLRVRRQRRGPAVAVDRRHRRPR